MSDALICHLTGAQMGEDGGADGGVEVWGWVAASAKTSSQCVTESLLHTWFSLLVFPRLLHVSLHSWSTNTFPWISIGFWKLQAPCGVCVCVIIFDQCFFSTPAPSAAQDRTKRWSNAELKSCHLIESGKTTTWRAHVWHSANTQQSTWHQFFGVFFFYNRSSQRHSRMKQLIQIIRDGTRTEQNDFPEKLGCGVACCFYCDRATLAKDEAVHFLSPVYQINLPNYIFRCSNFFVALIFFHVV